VVQFTGALQAELQRMRTSSADPALSTRIACSHNGSLKLELDRVRDDDVVLEDDSGSVWAVMARDIAEQLDDAILHFRGVGDDRYGGSGLVVLNPRSGAPRPAWSPTSAVAAAGTSVWTRVRRQLRVARAVRRPRVPRAEVPVPEPSTAGVPR
jgi:hypothetical protein